MKDGKTPSNYYRALQGFILLSAAGAFVSTFTIKLITPQPPTWMVKIDWDYDQLRAGAALVGIICSSAAGAAGMLKRYATHPNTWAQVQAILDRLQKDVFDKQKIPDHRITLFRRCGVVLWWAGWRPGWKWWWPWGPQNRPWSGWLKPFARSGMFSKKSRCIFLAPPHEPSRAEGVAGQAFQLFKSGTQLDPIENLPDLGPTSTPQERAAYASAGKVPIEWVDWMLQHNRQLPLSLMALSVEVDGKLWGVLVIDSRLPELPNKKQIDRATTSAAELLAAALRR